MMWIATVPLWIASAWFFLNGISGVIMDFIHSAKGRHETANAVRRVWTVSLVASSIFSAVAIWMVR
ncbi:MAG: hypothetical protein J0I08_23485 [Rhizobiales bacterium]|nr:hypothetical protein [Hyphomicrobiales bacterium]